MRDPGGLARILVTGAAGTIGSILCEALADEYAVLGLDAVRGPGVDRRGHDEARRSSVRSGVSADLGRRV